MDQSLVSRSFLPKEKTHPDTRRMGFLFLSEAGRYQLSAISFRDLLLVHHLLEFAGLEHFHHYVAAAHEFALYVKLRNGWPVGIGLDALSDFHVLQHIDAVVRDTAMLEDGDGLAGKSALREQRGALHEQDNIVRVDDFGNTLVGVGHNYGPKSGCWCRRGSGTGPIGVPD